MQPLTVRVAALEARIDQLLPDGRQICLLGTEKVYALPAGDLRVETVCSRCSVRHGKALYLRCSHFFATCPSTTSLSGVIWGACYERTG